MRVRLPFDEVSLALGHMNERFNQAIHDQVRLGLGRTLKINPQVNLGHVQLFYLGMDVDDGVTVFRRPFSNAWERLVRRFAEQLGVNTDDYNRKRYLGTRAPGCFNPGGDRYEDNFDFELCTLEASKLVALKSGIERVSPELVPFVAWLESIGIKPAQLAA